MDVHLSGVMTVGEAADVLGVSTQQVGHLGRSGEVTFVARGLLDAASVRALRAARQGRHTRALAPHTAWAAIAMLSGRNPFWLGQPQVSRLRSRLLHSNTSDLVAATRTRAKVYRYTGHRAAAARISEEPGTVLKRPLPELVEHRFVTETDWYVDAKHLEAMTKRYGLLRGESGDFVFRAVQGNHWHDHYFSDSSQHAVRSSNYQPNVFISHTYDTHTYDTRDNDATNQIVRNNDGIDHNRVQDPSHGPEREGVDLRLVAAVMLDSTVLTALDSSTSEDPRERGVAERILDDALTRFHRQEATNA